MVLLLAFPTFLQQSVKTAIRSTSYETAGAVVNRAISYQNARPSSTTVADDLYYQCKPVMIWRFASLIEYIYLAHQI